MLFPQGFVDSDEKQAQIGPWNRGASMQREHCATRVVGARIPAFSSNNESLSMRATQTNGYADSATSPLCPPWAKPCWWSAGVHQNFSSCNTNLSRSYPHVQVR